ncbi:MAG: CRISPR-associated endonuclease Cas2 [Defluviitaleaceae bacterium]|nr:CRISPR-associated endonuclease Cas2 [Defluviitaleaceae bacterium]
MLILITYDVSTLTPAGQRRLRKVAKICQNYGQRVQNSVFECVLDSSLLLVVKDKLLGVIDPSVDSLRFYMLGNNYKTKTEHYGAKPSFDVTAPLIL